MTTDEIIAALGLIGGASVATTAAIFFFVRAGKWMGKLDDLLAKVKDVEELKSKVHDHDRDIETLKGTTAKIMKYFSGRFPRVNPEKDK